MYITLEFHPSHGGAVFSLSLVPPPLLVPIFHVRLQEPAKQRAVQPPPTAVALPDPQLEHELAVRQCVAVHPRAVRQHAVQHGQRFAVLHLVAPVQVDPVRVGGVDGPMTVLRQRTGANGDACLVVPQCREGSDEARQWRRQSVDRAWREIRVRVSAALVTACRLPPQRGTTRPPSPL